MDATIRELNRKLTSEIASRERMETEWVGTRTMKGEIETQYVNIQGEKAKLDAQVKLMSEQLTSREEVSVVFLSTSVSHALLSHIVELLRRPRAYFLHVPLFLPFLPT